MANTFRLARLCALAVLVTTASPATSAQIPASPSGTPRLPSADSVVVDSFESVSQWRTNPAAGVEIAIRPDSGRHGRGLRVDFDFHGHTGYGILHRDVKLELPANYEFSFSVRGNAPTNTLEFKLVDPAGSSVWWSNNPNFIFPDEWRTITRRKRQICFAWGPAGGGELRRLSAIEFAITAGSGGNGTVWIDDLSLTTLDPDSPFDLTPPLASVPIVGTWESAQPSPNGIGAKLDFAADGSFSSIVGGMGDFTYSVANNRLTTKFKDAGPGAPDHYTNSIRIERDTLTQKGFNLFGNDLTMRRVGSATDGDDPVIGVWRFSDYTGGTAFLVFTRTGEGRIRLPMSACSGTWTDSGKGHLAMTINGQLAARDYRIENGVLTLMNVDGNEIKYNRMAPPE
jgi:hypothetical protein